MKILEDIFASLSGNVKTRANDPVIGAFILSWSLCNWDKLALLLWGGGKIDERVTALVSKMAVIDNPALLVDDLDLVILPLCLSLTYIFAFPRLAAWVSSVSAKVEVKRHDIAVDVEIGKSEKQKELNKQRLLADPSKAFLEQEVKQDQDKRAADVARAIADAERAKSESEQAKHDEVKAEAEAKKAMAEADIAQKKQLQEVTEAERKSAQAERDKRAIAASTAIHETTIASNNYPVAYKFLDVLNRKASDNGMRLSLGTLSSAIAAVFGYASYSNLLMDKNFNNRMVIDLRCVLLNTDEITQKLAEIADEAPDSEDIESDLLLEIIEEVFEELNIELLQEQALAESIYEEIESKSYKVLELDGLSGAMAETDTIFEEVSDLHLDRFEFDGQVFTAYLSGSASGTHRKDDDIPSRGIDFNLEATCKTVVGTYGLSDFELTGTGEPEDWGDPDNWVDVNENDIPPKNTPTIKQTDWSLPFPELKEDTWQVAAQEENEK